MRKQLALTAFALVALLSIASIAVAGSGPSTSISAKASWKSGWVDYSVFKSSGWGGSDHTAMIHQTCYSNGAVVSTTDKGVYWSDNKNGDQSFLMAGDTCSAFVYGADTSHPWSNTVTFSPSTLH